MKKFVYQVNGFEFVDTVAFGEAWKEAKAKATELHAAVYRLVVEDEQVLQEVYYKSGYFNSMDYMDGENVMVF